MYALRNKVQLIGNLGNTPEIRQIENGKTMARFRMATSENYRNAAGEWITDTQWHQLVAWGKTAEIIEKRLSKGAEVIIEGKLVSRSYVDKDGNKRYITEVHISEVLLLAAKEMA